MRTLYLIVLAIFLMSIATAYNNEASSYEIVKIADPKVKNIPIHENYEELVDLADPKINPSDSKIKLMPPQEKPHFGFYHAPHDNCFEVRRGLFSALRKLVSNLPKNIGIYVYEAYRPLSIQKEYFDKLFYELKAENPSLSDKEIFTKTAIFISPVLDNVPPHSTGGAIDITLINLETGIPLDMGKFGVLFGPDPVFKTHSNEITPTQRKNRNMLIHAATKAGLVNYPMEWWHYSLGDKYAAYCLGQKYAVYGIVQE